MRYIISVLTENHFGVLARISGLFSARGFNIDSLAVGKTDDPSISRMTITVNGNEEILEQIMKQLNKLIDVIKVTKIHPNQAVERDLILIKVSVAKDKTKEISDMAHMFKAKVVDMNQESCVIEFTGEEGQIEKFINMLKPYGIKEMARTGVIAISK